MDRGWDDSKIFLNTGSVLQSAAFRMSLVVTPESAAAVTEALLVEWAVNILISTPESFNTSFSYLAIVQGTTGL